MATKSGERLLRAALSAAVAARLTDAELLQRFIDGNEAAFEVLVKRYDSMVLGVCRRVLPTLQDAEDACQATFLVLSRKAKTGRWQASIANWLYTIARRVALNVSRTAARRSKREGRPVPPTSVSALDQMTGREAFAALDEELGKLAPIYREPLVLCYLQGLTRDEAAIRLGIPVATLKSQLDRGRKKLADALTKRGIVVGIGLIAVAATSSASASSPRLVELILATVGGSPSPTVAALALEVTVNGVLSKGKWLLLALVAAAVSGVGFSSMPIAAKPHKARLEKPEQQRAKPEDKQAKQQQSESEERTIRGKVLGADGMPIEAELTVLWLESKPVTLGKSKPDGTFQVTVPFKLNRQGGYLLAKAPGHGTDFCATGVSHLAHSMTKTAELTLKLPREQRIGGRILDSQGKPVSAAGVVATTFSAFDSDASRDAHLTKWATQGFQHGVAPGGDRGMWFSDRYGTNPSMRSPYRATTDQDGRFAIPGIGAGQLVQLAVQGKGLCDKEIVLLNRTGFDPSPINKLAHDNEIRGSSFNNKWRLYGPEPVIVLETEKIIRGSVTDQEGKPRAGVRVVFSRPNKGDLNPDYNSAITDKEGHYEIRGARKHKGYMVECPPDPDAGLLQCQGFADDTPGYEPITIDLKCAKGVVIQGTIKKKGTNEPISALMYVDVLANNPFVKKYPDFRHAASISSEKNRTDKEGRFKVVTIPGPVILMASPVDNNQRSEFLPPVPDPKYPDSFTNWQGSLMFHGYEGGQGFVQGCWCKVINAKETDTLLTVHAELEPATKLRVKVADSEGKFINDIQATGTTHVNFDRPVSFPDTDTLTIWNVDPKTRRLVVVFHEKRKLVGSGIVRREGNNVDSLNQVIKLGPGGSITGRIVDAKSKPIAGLGISLIFDNREVEEAFKGLKKTEATKTDSNGEFRIDTVFPEQSFRLWFSKGKKKFGPAFDKAPKHTIAHHNDTLKLGDLKLEPTTEGEEE